MKESIQAVYNTLAKLEMPMTPNNAKCMSGIYICLEKMYQELENKEKDEPTGGD